MGIFRKIKNFFVDLKRSCKWFKRMWGNYDFDDGYLMQVIVWKMKDMLYQLDVVDKYFVDLRNQPHYKDIDNEYGGDMLKSLEDCIEIGERLIADDYVVYPDAVEKWFSNNDRDITKRMPDDIRKMFIEATIEAEDRKSEDNEKFFNILKKYHWCWWS
jgi:hypothetical protein